MKSATEKECEKISLDEVLRLEINKWYKNDQLAKFRILGFNKNDQPIGFGFSWSGVFVEEDYNGSEGWNIEGISEMTCEEIEEVLIREAIKLEYSVNSYIVRDFDEGLEDTFIDGDQFKNDPTYFYNMEGDFLEYLGFVIYSKGNWAKIVPTMTQEEAEEN